MASLPGCVGPQNSEYRAGGYYYAIEVLPSSSDLVVAFYDGGHYVTGGEELADGTSTTGDRSWAWHWPADQRGVELEYILYGPDATPTDPTDNSDVRCTGNFPVNGPDPEGHFNSYSGNNNCSVTGQLTEGIWVLQLPAPLWEGATKFAVQASVSGLNQPLVYGILDKSVYVNFTAGSAEPFLAEIRPEHAEKLLEVDIFDLGDNNGPAHIQFMPPGGPRDCTWSSSNGLSGASPSCRIDIDNQRFNNDWLYVDIPLDGYTCNPSGTGCWWRVHIETSSGAAHDRTTWGARVSGDPVRLVD